MEQARVVMLQGTASHAGKTVLAAALCRIYARRGLRVVPFKAQNMALNSFVTDDGAEMGRAQVFQARAAGLEPHVDMNPVLLKPSADATSQVVVMGRPVGHMTVREYHAYQADVWPLVTEALARLRASSDLVVIEGAGSSAEVNLRGQDIVNMRVAVHARAPVLLVGDIDRGGVFASLLGHVDLFSREERDLVAGFVINKFRGDASQLDTGIEILRERTGVPTLGVIPFLEGWGGDEEDSVGLEDERRRGDAYRNGPRRGRPGAPLRIVVVRLPYISNFTDLDALAAEPDVDLRLVTGPAGLEGAAAIVLPGTKSTVADLAWLRRTGLAAAVQAAAAAGTPLIGLCGGYQMLGRRILDPEHVESGLDEVAGLGLLDVVTTFAAGKRTERCEGEVLGPAGPPAAAGPRSAAGTSAAAAIHAEDLLGPPGTAVRGYEIHMGRTVLGPAAVPLLRLRPASAAGLVTGGAPGLSVGEEHAAGPNERLDGAASAAGLPVCGTYLHGLFDHPDLRAAFLNGLRAARGLPPRPAADPEADDLEVFADHVERHLDIAALDRIAGLESGVASG